ncbi:hypothetical protein [Microlunatus soli]|uniref:hypothetical protein n=1 Tax=Microlunatus soli TaxID=630515 RepID=UPI0012F98ED9|nr:hypothetical protein [Microlunatus soli]
MIDPTTTVDTCGVEPVLDRRPPFEAVLELLGREDPKGLLAIGAPISEYDLEADEIARRLRAGQPISDEVLVEVWERWFGPGSGYVRRTSKSQVSKLAAHLDALH